MSVFISWSKRRSQVFALALRTFIDRCIQAAKPWTSEETPAGAAWAETILTKLEGAVLGIVCVTRDNQKEPWLLFEGGALYKQEILHVIAVDIAPNEIEYPFAIYQATVPTREGMLKVLRSINERLPEASRRTDAQLVEACNLNFAEFEKELERVRAIPTAAKTEERTPEDMLKELVTTTRQIASAVIPATPSLEDVWSESPDDGKGWTQVLNAVQEVKHAPLGWRIRKRGEGPRIVVIVDADQLKRSNTSKKDDKDDE